MTIDIDNTVLTLNKKIKKALLAYFPNDVETDQKVQLTFELPDQKYPPNTNTISVFLYNVQEDLQMRSSEIRHYDPLIGKSSPGIVHICCCYLFTYWPAIGRDTAHDGPNSEATRAMNRVLNALLNHNTFADLPGSYTRVLPPQERLNSLGNFWQAMGNKPKLCLSYLVTIPVRLGSDKQNIKPIKKLAATLNNQDADNALERVAATLWQRLCNTLCDQEASNRETILLELGRTVASCVPIMQNTGEPCLRLILSGVTTKACKTALLEEIWAPRAESEPQTINERWSTQRYRIGGEEMSLMEVNVDQLIES